MTMPLYNRDADPSSVPTVPDGPALIGIIVPLAVSTVFVLGRAWSRFFIVSSWGLDDTSIIAAWVTTLACIVFLGMSASYGPSITPSCFIFNYVSVITYFISVFLTKLSILLFYLRILPPIGSSRSSRSSSSSRASSRSCEPERLWSPRLLTQVTIFLVTCYSIPLLIASTIACTPQTPGKFYFNSHITCVPLLPVLYVNTVLNAITDIWLLAIIVPCIVGLQLMRPRQKAALVVLFSGGAVLVVVAGLVRVIKVAGAIATKPVSDWNIDSFNFWTAIELSMGLACASVPGVVPLLRKMAPGVMGSIMGDSGRGSDPNTAAAAGGAWTGANRSELVGHKGSSKSRGSGDENGTILELHGGGRNQSVIRCFAKGGKQAVRFGAQPAKKMKKAAWFGAGWGEGEKNNARRQADNESQEDVLSSREGADERRPGTGIVKTSEVMITESRVNNSDDDWP